MDYMNLTNFDEIYQIYNIDLEEYLGVKGQVNNTTVVNNYIAEKQEMIFRFIAGYRYYGMGDIDFLLSVPEYYKVIKKAVQLQIKYEVRSGVDLSTASRVYLDSNKIMTIERGLLEEEMISREARDLLRSCAGLLYSGRG